MKKIIVFLVVCLMAVPTYGLWDITYDNVSNPESLTLLLQDRLGVTGGSYAFSNGLTIDNSTNNVFEWNENSEEIKWTFSSDTLTLSSSTGVVTFAMGAIVPTANQMLFTPVSSAVGTTEGTVYYDSDTDKLFVRNASTWVDLTAGASAVTDLDTAYNGGNTIDVDGSAVTLTVSDTDNNAALIVVQNDTTNDPTAMQITSAADAANAIALDIDAQTTGRDIEGTGASFYVEGDGSVVATDLDATGAAGLTLQNDATITNAVDSEITFTDTSEDITLDMDSASNVVGLKSSTGVTGLAMGAVDDLSGVGTIAFDAAASSISLASTGDAQDLTIAVTGANNASLFLQSAGTGADAIAISTTAGGIDVTVAGGASGEDLDLTASTSVNIKASEASADDSIVIQAQGAGSGIDIISLGDIDITTTGAATEDIQIINTGGSMVLRANEDDAAAITIDTTGGGGTSEAININNDQGTAEDSIDIDSTAGGMDIDVATGKNMSITAGQFLVNSNENVASAISLSTNTGAAETIVFTNSQGTDNAAIDLVSTLGGITLTVAAAKTITAEGSITLENGQLIEGVNDNRIEFNDNSDSLELIFGSNKIELGAGSSGVVTLDFNDVDALEDIDTITLENGLVMHNTNDGRFEITEATDSLELIFGGADSIQLGAGSTGTNTIDFNDVDTLTGIQTITGDGTGYLGGFSMTVTDDTDGKTLNVNESGTVQTNAGAGGAQAWTLPTAAAGLTYTFVVGAAQELRVTPAAGDKIIYGGTAMALAEYYWADAVGEALTIVAIDATNWVVLSSTGTWTEETP